MLAIYPAGYQWDVDSGWLLNIGDNVRVGANCVVVENIPNNSTVVLPKPRIIVRIEKF